MRYVNFGIVALLYSTLRAQPVVDKQEEERVRVTPYIGAFLAKI